MRTASGVLYGHGRAAAYEQKQGDEALMREQTRPTFSRPDLGYDVTSGIQQRNLRR